MRIVHLNTFERTGGAALGTYYLHDALEEKGVSSVICSRDGRLGNSLEEKPVPESHTAIKIKNRLYSVLKKIYRNARWSNYSTSFSSSLILEKLIQSEQPDLLHVHWINQNYLNPKDLLRVNIPVIVTLRDFWFVTGGCHYPGECDHFRTGCGNCPELGSRQKLDFSSFQARAMAKLRYKKHIHFVAISEWMKCQVKRVNAPIGWNLQVIPNCIPTDTFIPMEKRTCRSKMGLDDEGIVFLYPSLSPWRDKRKGGDMLLEGLIQIARSGVSLKLLCVDDELPSAGKRPHENMEIISIPRANDIESMNAVYGAADVVAVPSIYEAFGKVTAEALACGRPVVAFRETGADDIIQHKLTGYLAKNSSPESLEAGLKWTIENLKHLINNASMLRESVCDRFSPAVVAEQYCRLYNDALAMNQ